MTKILFTEMTEEELNAFITRVEDAIEYNLTLEKKRSNTSIRSVQSLSLSARKSKS